jgi:hypothetical protein
LSFEPSLTGKRRKGEPTDMRIHLSLFLWTIGVACSPVFSQQNDLSLLLSDLRSPEVQKRSAAYTKIAADKEALKRSEVKAALIDLLDRENQTLRKARADSKSYGESYGEYVSYLADTAAEIADWRDQQQVCILAHSPYDPGSEFASDLVIKGGAAVIPCLLKLSQGGFGDRYQSIPLLVHFSASTSKVSPAVNQQVRDAIMSGVSDSNVLVRQGTVEAIGKYGKQDMIPVLQKIAESDPVSRRLNSGKLYFTVRESAIKAIQSIQERTNASEP